MAAKFAQQISLSSAAGESSKGGREGGEAGEGRGRQAVLGTLRRQLEAGAQILTERSRK